MALEAAAIEQPKPIQGDKVVSEFILSLDCSYDEQLVLDDIVLRLEVGEKKYGSPLMTLNGRNADLDTYQELCDAFAYAVQGAMETADHNERQVRLDEAHMILRIAVYIRYRYLESLQI